MADGSPPAHESRAEHGPEPKRRKVRKGTQSCWECKRRKVRCTFAAPAEVICDSCQRRGTTCVGQEFPDEKDEPASTGDNKQVMDRLGRMEALVEQLAKKAGTSDSSKDLSDSLPRERRGVRREPASLRSTSPGISTPAASGVGDPAYPSSRRVDHEIVVGVSCCHPSLYLF